MNCRVGLSLFPTKPQAAASILVFIAYRAAAHSRGRRSRLKGIKILQQTKTGCELVQCSPGRPVPRQTWCSPLNTTKMPQFSAAVASFSLRRPSMGSCTRSVDVPRPGRNDRPGASIVAMSASRKPKGDTRRSGEAWLQEGLHRGGHSQGGGQAPEL